jgi:VanZ family protein
MVLAICAPENLLQFRLFQYRDGLIARRNGTDLNGHWKETVIGVSHIFYQDTPAFVTMTGGSTNTNLYINGQKVDDSSHFGLVRQDFSGQLILAASPFGDAPWHGDILGLAIYNSELSSSEVMAHYQMWTHQQQLELAHEERPIAIYDFHEHFGRIIHNLSSGAPDLLIPSHYSVPYKKFLEPPWSEFRADSSYVKDILINTAGFIPLGVSTYLLLVYSWPIRRAVWTTILIGMATSVTIEVLQAFIPSRDSGITDILTNTAGTSIGVFLCTQVAPKILGTWIKRCSAQSVP